MPSASANRHDARVTTTWGAGEYSLMAERLEPVAVRVVNTAGVKPGDHVLDVATGTGNAALLAADRGADVIGVDLETTWLDIAKARATRTGVRVWWERAEMTTLPVPDRWANTITSVFGVMYSLDHDQVARELSRCLASNGQIVLASWIPGSFMSAMGQVLAEFLPSPPPSRSGPPNRWGDAAVLEDLFKPNGLHVSSHSIESLALTFDDATTATQFLVITAGNVMAERTRLTAQGRWNEMWDAMHRLVETRSEHDTSACRIMFTFLLATIEY